MSELRDVIVSLPVDQFEFIERVAEREATSPGDVLRRAIALEKYFLDMKAANRKILVEDGQRLREVVRHSAG